MKTLIPKNSEGRPAAGARFNGGGVLVTVLVMLTILAVVAGAMLTLVYQEYALSKRSLAWNQSIYAAETGVELAWNELNKLTGINTNSSFMSGTNWTMSTSNGTNMWTCNATVSSSIGNEFSANYAVTLNTNRWVINSTGMSSSSRISTPVSRSLAVYVSPTTPFEWAILSKGTVNFGGNNPIVDSWNSNIGTGVYSAVPGAGYTRRMNGTVGTDGNLVNAAAAQIYGSVSTGAGGVVATSPGFNMYSDATSRNGTNTISDGLKVYIPSASAPTGWQTYTPVTPTTLPAISGNTTCKMLGADHANLAISGSGTLILYVDSFSQMNAEGITITPNPAGSSLKVVLYVQNNLNLVGDGGLNAGGAAANLQIYGLPTCTSIDLGGMLATRAAVYAPDSNLTIHGVGGFFGSLVGKNFTLAGASNIHYDEVLDTVGNKLGFSLVSYREQ